MTWRQMGGNVCASVSVGGGDDQGGEEESSLCVERSEGWGCSCVGRRYGAVGRVLFKKA